MVGWMAYARRKFEFALDADRELWRLWGVFKARLPFQSRQWSEDLLREHTDPQT